MRKGKGVINKTISKLPFEIHLPGHNFTGPETQSLTGKTRLNPDLSYKSWNWMKQPTIMILKNKDTKTRNEICDKQMLKDLDNIQNPSFKERIERGIVKPIIWSKKTFGLGPLIYCVECRKKTKTIKIKTEKDKRGKIEYLICKEEKRRRRTFKPPPKKSLEEIYYNPETGYRVINDLVRKTGYSQKEVSEFLHKQDVFILHKPIKKKFETRRVYAPYKDYQWVANLAFMQKDKGFKYILTIIDAFTKYAWAIPIRNKTGDEITNAFREIFKERKPERMQTGKGTDLSTV
ncbi:hypothetical protein LAZ67_9001785 [Cordylochernes scorpioides]|uniref:Integrase catalytic domain-containing protein n=1 Tax=Cordylochernes scorpioides TaxID=51811 RepID=A0ABY6KYA4_9ARAC|nr:hypothetical protein LAZ67_9001785 [Cordylochernes scorpioides]